MINFEKEGSPRGGIDFDFDLPKHRGYTAVKQDTFRLDEKSDLLDDDIVDLNDIQMRQSTNDTANKKIFKTGYKRIDNYEFKF